MDERDLLLEDGPGNRPKDEFWRTIKVRVRYYVPVLHWLPLYKWATVQQDIIAGVTVASVMIPQSISYAQALVNVPPVFGLISAFVSEFLYAIFGTSRQLAVGPESLAAILAGSSVKEFIKWRDANPVVGMTDPEIPDIYRNIQPTALLCLLVGIFTFLLGFFRLGFLDSVLSRALLRGFVLAVACVVIIEMSKTLLGLIDVVGQCQIALLTVVGDVEIEPESPFQTLLSILANLSNLHTLTACISVASILFLVGAKYFKQKHSEIKGVAMIPEVLVLVIFSTTLSYIFRWDCDGVAILNTIERTVPDYVKTYPIPTVPKMKHLLLSAILISMIGFVESIAVAKTYASKHNYSVSPNRELVALGVGNTMASLFGAFPSFGSLGRSAINNAAGAQTQLAGFFTGLVVFVTYMWLLPLFEYLPKAVCSAIIVVAASKLIEFDEVYFMIRLRAWKDLLLMMVTFCSTIFISIETGTLLSVGVSLILVVQHTTRTRLKLLGEYTYTDPLTGVEIFKYKGLREGPNHPRKLKGVLIIRFEEGLFFGNVGQLQEKLNRIETHGDIGIHPGEDPLDYGEWHEPSSPEDELESNPEDPIRETVTPISHVIFDMKSVGYVDASATQSLLEIVQEYRSRGIKLSFVKLRDECLTAFTNAGIVEAVGEENFHKKIRAAIHPPGSNPVQYYDGLLRPFTPSSTLPVSRSRTPQSQGITSFDELRDMMDVLSSP